MNISNLTVVGYFLIVNVFMVAFAIYDIKHMQLSMKLYYWFAPIALLSIIPNLIINNYDIALTIRFSLISAVIVFTAFFLIAFIGGTMGGGDVKLIVLIGFIFAAKTPIFLFVMMFSAVIIGGIIYTKRKLKIKKGYIIVNDEQNKQCNDGKKLGIIFSEISKNTIIPFIPYMTLGSICTSILTITLFLK